MMAGCGKDPSGINPLEYLADLVKNNGDLSPTACLEHYQVLRLALLRLQSEDLAAYDLALQEVSKRLKVRAKTVRDDLARLADPPPAKEAIGLLDKMGQTRTLRLAQDYQDGKLWFGVIAGDDKLLLNSDRALLTLDQVPDGLIVKDSGFDYCRLSKDAILLFLSGGMAADAELLADLRQFFSRFAVFRDNRVPLLCATWALGTYAYRVFRVFPYLGLRSPDKRCGKSRVLDILSLLAFNASPRVVHPTEAQIFRGPSRNGGTLLLDEVETLKNADKEGYAGLLAVLNSGFERGGIVTRLKKSADGGFPEETHETFAPRAIAGLKRLAETLEDRCVTIMMQRKLAREKTERFSPSRLEEAAQALRDRCYLWALTHATTLAAVYDQADTTFLMLSELDDRARDLWEPLVSITSIADTERADGKRTLTEELTALALDLCQMRDATAEGSTIVQIVQALWQIIAEKRKEQAEGEITLTPTELANQLKEHLKWEKLSTKGLAALLNPLGLCSKSSRDKTQDKAKERGRRYHLKTQELKDLADRYGEQPKEEKTTDVA